MLGKNPGSIRLHFLGICGIAMGQLAIELKRLGYQISGMDDQCDPPMSGLLADAGIAIESEDRLPVDCDYLVAGRGMPPDHPLLDQAEEQGVAVVSFPELVARLTSGANQRVVIAGTKGKTTTTAMLAWITNRAGLQPDYLIGGASGGLDSGLRLNQSKLAILEGDEYASSPTDPTPKLFHYRATAAVLTNIYPDHVELYAEPEQYCGIFESWLADLPDAGFAVVAAGAGTEAAIAASSVPVITVGWNNSADLPISNYRLDKSGAYFDFLGIKFHLPVIGRANAIDAALATAAAQRLGIEPGFSAEALTDFQPVRERLEKIGEPGGIRFYVESNSHPAALQLAVEALRENYPSGRLLCVVQPQTPGPGDGYVQINLPAALARASHVIITPVSNQAPEDFSPPFSCEQLVGELTALGVEAAHRTTRKTIVSWVAENSAPGDTILLAVHIASRALLTREITTALLA